MSLCIEGMEYVLHTAQQVDRLGDILKSRLAAGVALAVKVRAWTPPKTRRQRDYAHALIRQCADVLRCDERLLKDDLKAHLGCVRVRPSLVTGDREALPVPTELYTREEYTAWITSILAWAAQQGILLPDPEDHELAEAVARERAKRMEPVR